MHVNDVQPPCGALDERVLVDFDNEMPFDLDVVLLSKTDEVTNFSGRTINVKEGDRLCLIMDTNDGDYAVAEGVVIKNPYAALPACKWCCKLTQPIEYLSECTAKRASK